MPWWPVLDRLDALALSPHVQDAKALFFLALVVGFGLCWLWQHFNDGGQA